MAKTFVGGGSCFVKLPLAAWFDMSKQLVFYQRMTESRQLVNAAVILQNI